MEKTYSGLAEYAEAQLGRPYWYGCYGQIACASLYEGKKKQYPKYYTANDFPTQYGQRVYDCSGLIKGYMFSDTPEGNPKYSSKYDYSANGLRKACKEMGDITDMPDLPGICVFMEGHVGVYIGGGYVIEARGHKYGVVKTKLAERPWLRWGKHPDIAYTDTPAQACEKNVVVTLEQLSFGSTGAEVATVQRLMNALGYRGKTGKALTVDGKLGEYTRCAIKAFQNANALTSDGIVGSKTWYKLLKG